MENNNQIQNNVIGQFMGKLVSVNPDIQTNSNGKQYLRVQVELTNAAGVTRSEPAIIYKANFDKLEKGLQIGESYLTTLSEGANGLAYLQMSHLQGEQRSSVDDLKSFGIQGLRTATRRAPAVAASAVPQSAATAA